MNWSRRKSFLEELMVHILRESKKPMTLTEIVNVIKESHPSALTGKTPTNSLYSIVYRNEKRRTEIGIPVLFNKEYIGRDCVYSLKAENQKKSYLDQQEN